MYKKVDLEPTSSLGQLMTQTDLMTDSCLTRARFSVQGIIIKYFTRVKFSDTVTFV